MHRSRCTGKETFSRIKTDAVHSVHKEICRNVNYPNLIYNKQVTQTCRRDRSLISIQFEFSLIEIELKLN